jgi:hypothetical protein
MSNKKGFCVAPFRNAEFQSNGLVWQCCFGVVIEEETNYQNIQIFTNF